MDVETITLIMIIIHATFGTAALLGGGVALVVQKGGTWHKRGGKLFFGAMVSSVALSLVIAIMPGHVNPFLFAVGIFSAYFVLGGMRVLQLRSQPLQWRDWWLAGFMMLVGVAMFALSFTMRPTLKPAVLVFGLLAIANGLNDWRVLRLGIVALRKRWLKLHLSKMTAGYIAATTAFLVVNSPIRGELEWINWLSPTVIGGIYIGYWSRRVKRR